MSLPSEMRALMARGVKDYALQNIAIPACGDDDLIIRVEACGICAGDIKASHGTARFWGGDGMPGYCRPPFVPGHEFLAGWWPGAKTPTTGSRLATGSFPNKIVPCGECYYCKRGMYWLCDPHDVYGFKSYLNGGMAEYARLPKGSRNYRVPEELTLEQAALIEPLPVPSMACARPMPQKRTPWCWPAREPWGWAW